MRGSTLTATRPIPWRGILMVEGTGRLEDTVFFVQHAGTGAGAYFASESVTLTNNAFLSNTAQYEGGGVIVEIYGGHSELVGNYVAGNRAYFNGGGLYFGEEVRLRMQGVPLLFHAGGMGPGERLSLPQRHRPQLDAGDGGGVYMGGDGGAADLWGTWWGTTRPAATAGGSTWTTAPIRRRSSAIPLRRMWRAGTGAASTWGPRPPRYAATSSRATWPGVTAAAGMAGNLERQHLFGQQGRGRGGGLA